MYPIEKLRHIGLEIGTVANDFSMTRGSFRYRQKASPMEKLRFIGSMGSFDGHTGHGQGCLLDYEDGRKRRHRLQIREEGGLIHVTYLGVCSDACQSLQETAEQKQNQENAGSVPSGEGRVWRPDPSVNHYRLHIACEENEHFYGCGETYSVFDLKGQKVRIWVAEHQNADRIAKKLIRNMLTGRHPDRVLPFSAYESYYAQPTFTSSGKYFVHVKTDRFAEFDFTGRNEIVLDLQEAPSLVIGDGESFPEVSEKLSSLLGRQQALPDWIYDGSILAIQQGPEVIDRKLSEAQAAGAKICGVWSQDWCGCRRTGFGYQVMWNWSYDRTLYHDLPEKIREWKAKGIRFLGYINPFLAIERELYQEASRRGYCVKDRQGKDYLVTITTFPAAMIDFTNPEAYEWYKNLIRQNMIGIGMSGWMADFGEYLPVDCVLHDGSDPYELHNEWPAIWARLNREAIEESGKEGEVFFFTRAGHTGTVRYSDMMWTGDQHVDWSVDDGIGSVIPATLSLAMSGFGITHSDVGGYTTMKQMKRSKELLLRWEEMNVFSPLWRSHEGNQPANDVQFDGDADLLEQLARCSRMHAALKPYLQTLAAEEAAKGTPVMRPLFYQYDEPEAYEERNAKTEYLLGRDILVAPILQEGAVSREVYLPKDDWIHIWTGRKYTGGHVTVQAPIGQPPVFVRRSSPYSGLLLTIRNKN